MKDRRCFSRTPLLLSAIIVALLLLAGTYIAVASQTPPSAPESTFQVSNGPTSWSSGWVNIPPSTSETFTHGLGHPPEELAVELLFRDLNDGWGINRRYYGGFEDNGDWYGAHWYNLMTNTVSVYHQQEDDAADRIRIRVWIVPEPPDADSGWMDIAAGETITFSHGLGITATELSIGMWFSSSSPLMGIHNYGYGGVAIDQFMRMEGAHWHNLTDDSIQISRHPDDQQVQQVRVVVVHGTTPQYDSLVDLGDWQDVAPGTVFTFTHNLGWNPNLMLARAECYSSTAGIHHWLAGGSLKGWPPFGGWKGANLQNLTANTVQVFRGPSDDICPQVRVRIWKRDVQRLFLPLVLKDEDAS